MFKRVAGALALAGVVGLSAVGCGWDADTHWEMERREMAEERMRKAHDSAAERKQLWHGYGCRKDGGSEQVIVGYGTLRSDRYECPTATYVVSYRDGRYVGHSTYR